MKKFSKYDLMQVSGGIFEFKEVCDNERRIL